MILDSHCHAWARWPYQPPVPDPESRGRVEQLLWEMDQNGVAQAVIICAGITDNPDNNDYVAAAVARHPHRLHQFADLDGRWSTDYHTEGVPDRLQRLADRLPLKGITHYLNDHNDGWLLSDEASALFTAMAGRGLVLSLACTPDWLADIRAIAAGHPSLTILLHHLAGARLVPGRVEAGLREIVAAAPLPNVMVKLSGLYYGADRPWDFPNADATWIVRTLYDAFPPQRLCWGSDYPVLRRHITYRQSLEAVRTHCPFITAADRDWILGRSLQTILRTG